MSKLGTLLQIADVGISLSNFNQLESLKKQQQNAQMQSALIQLARDILFNFKQSAQNIVDNQDMPAKVALAKLILLKEGYQQLGITPEIFPEIQDKEYAVSTAKQIDIHVQSLQEQFTKEELEEIHSVAHLTKQIDDLNYYVENYNKAQKYEEIAPKFNQLKSRNEGCASTLIAICAVVFGCAIPTQMCTMLGMSTQSDVIMNISSLIGLGIGIYIVYYYFTTYRQSSVYRDAKAQMDSIGDVDLPRFKKISNQYSFNGLKSAEISLKQSEEVVKAFFGKHL